ncbi:MAG: AsnC family transcriptional regulator [Thiofilum sp.]|uniref:Lrp/AsnC family transcriptional regulator n=1 Tax=Thiofilum sp. TaxID=2212733 RepID=UPI0025F9EE4F|nr:AsnC family transcriptional regulator [Thiofilum sp.]MBK8454438.1 winged helix-turn-helix transcriptional regulator [Thiofilum sp.]
MNSINQAIIKLLKANSRMSWQQIGKQVYLTGQAVAARVQALEDQGIISGYTIRQDQVERHFITMFMDTNQFERFEQWLSQDERVESAYKTIGEGCYHIVFVSHATGDLEPFLNGLLKYGRYKVASMLKVVK